MYSYIRPCFFSVIFLSDDFWSLVDFPSFSIYFCPFCFFVVAAVANMNAHPPPKPLPGRKADAQRAKQLLAGLHDLQKLDPVQRDAILSSVMQGMTMEEAMHLVRDFVRKASAANNRGAPRLKNAITSKIPNKKRQEKLVEKRKRRLGRMLATLDSVQAHPIASAVESGTMGVDEVSSNMPSACLCSCA